MNKRNNKISGGIFYRKKADLRVGLEMAQSFNSEPTVRRESGLVQ